MHLLPEGRNWRIDYIPAGLARLLEQLEKVAPTLIAMGASAGYERACADRLAGAGLEVAVINPRLGRRFAGSLGKLAKTDQIDAAMIARYAAFAKPTTRHTPDPAQAMLMALTVRRRQLVSMTVMERQRTDPGHVHPAILAGIKRHLRALEKEQAKLETQIDALIASHPLWARMTAALQEVTGVGPQAATALITHLPEIGTLNCREAAALAGLAPINRDSGMHRCRRCVHQSRLTETQSLSKDARQRPPDTVPRVSRQ